MIESFALFLYIAAEPLWLLGGLALLLCGLKGDDLSVIVLLAWRGLSDVIMVARASEPLELTTSFARESTSAVKRWKACLLVYLLGSLSPGT